MNEPNRALEPTIVDDETTLTTSELCRSCRVDVVEIETWGAEGVLAPAGTGRDGWRFSGTSIARMRVARRLSRDLDVNPPGVALALELMDEIAALRARLARRG